MLNHFIHQSSELVYFVARAYKNTISDLEMAKLGKYAFRHPW